jgi:hypothetical protein
VIQSPVFDLCQGQMNADTLLQKDLYRLRPKNYKQRQKRRSGIKIDHIEDIYLLLPRKV